MPSYEYYCSKCQEIFEELLISSEEIEKYSQKHPCKKCKGQATKIPSTVNFNFKAPKGQTQGSGVHGQSGVHDLDYPSLDKAIGRSSTVKWKNYHERKKNRDKARREYGTNFIATHGDTVIPLDKNQLEIRSKGMKLYKKAVESTRKNSK